MSFLITFLILISKQIIGLFGIFFIFGALLAYFQNKTNQEYQKIFGWKGILWTAWLGTPVHELSHWLMAKIFHHRIIRLSLFSPNPHTGGLGEVQHAYDRHSFYQRLGNIFIGLSPLFIGLAGLYFLLYFLVPNGPEIIHLIRATKIDPSEIVHILGNFFSATNLTTWHFWLFLYLSVCLASHLSPSWEDIKNTLSSWLWLLFFLLILDTGLLFFHLDPLWLSLKFNTWIRPLFFLCGYALGLSFFHYLAVLIFLRPLSWLRRKSFTSHS
ncbi:MAG TPA: hypothetical protein VJB37_03290 [Patescibacteria group bacterium]|nr:hypothetical protein [Patescibacteria group bacterium]